MTDSDFSGIKRLSQITSHVLKLERAQLTKIDVQNGFQSLDFFLKGTVLPQRIYKHIDNLCFDETIDLK